MSRTNVVKTIGRTVTTLDEAALYHPMLHSGNSLPGLPWLRRADGTHRPAGLDLVLMKRLGIGDLTTPSVGFIGDQGIGKTLAVNVFCARQSMYDVGRDAFGRISFDSEKRNAGEKPETYELSKFVNDTREDGVYVVSLLKAGFNPLRMHVGMNIWTEDSGEPFDEKKYHIDQEEVFTETYDMMVSILETLGEPFDDFEHDVFEDILRPLVKEEGRSVKLLCKRLLKYTVATSKQIASEMFDLDQDEDTLIDEFAMDFKKTALTLYLRVKRLLRGKLGRFLGGTDDSLLHYMSSKMVSFDFKGLTDEMRTLAHLILWKLRASATLHNFRERFSHVNVHDESYDKWRIPSFAKSMYLAMKTLRERGAIEISIFHRLKDMESVSSAGQETARYAENAVNEISVWFIGRQPRSEFGRLKERFNLPQNVLNTLPTLKVGFFWLIVGNLQPELVYVMPTRLELELFNTDTANNELLSRYYDTNDPEDYLRYLESLNPPPVENDEESEEAHEMAPA